MKPCNKCFDTVWKFIYLDEGIVRAECQMCGNEVEWQVKKMNYRTYKPTEVDFKTIEGVLYRDGKIWI